MATPQALVRIMNSARPHLPGALDAAMQFELFQVIDEMCRETSIWKEDIPFTVNTTDTTFLITPAEGGEIVRLVAVANSDLIGVKAVMEIPGEVTFQFAQSQIDTYTAKVAKTIVDPTRDDGYPVIPDWILTRCNTQIVDGLVARMMSQPLKPYSNERMGIYKLRRWRNALAIIRKEVQHMNLQDGQAWRFPRWA